MNNTRRNFLKNVAKAISFMGLPIYNLVEAIAAPSQLNIGIIASLTGSLAKFGEEGLRGAQLAVDEINSSGGIRGIKTHITIMDDQGKVQQGYIAFKALAEAYNTIALIGTTTITYDKTLSELAERYKLPFFVLNPFRRSWYREGLKYTFRIVPEVSLMAEQALSYLKEIANKNKVAISKICIFRSQSQVWDEALEKIVAASKREKLSIEFTLSIPNNISDIHTIVRENQNIPCDILFLLTGNESHTKVLVETLREVKYKTKAIVGFFSQIANSAYVSKNGNLFLNIMDANYWGDPKRDEIKIFQKRFLNQFGVYPSNDAYGTYTAIMLLKYAIEKCGSIEKSSFTSFMREKKLPNFLLAQRDGISFNNQGQNLNAETILLQVSNPRPIAIYPERFADGKPVFPI